MSDLVEVVPLKTFSLEGRVVSPQSGSITVVRRQLAAFEARGLVRELDPTAGTGTKSSASPVAPASPRQTSHKSATGARKKKVERSSSPTPPSE